MSTIGQKRTRKKWRKNLKPKSTANGAGNTLCIRKSRNKIKDLFGNAKYCGLRC